LGPLVVSAATSLVETRLSRGKPGLLPLPGHAENLLSEHPEFTLVPSGPHLDIAERNRRPGVRLEPDKAYRPAILPTDATRRIRIDEARHPYLRTHLGILQINRVDVAADIDYELIPGPHPQIWRGCIGLQLSIELT